MLYENIIISLYFIYNFVEGAVNIMFRNGNNIYSTKERNDMMPDLFNLTPEMNSYFNSLPKNLQETIIQSGAKINSLTDLKQVAKEFSGNEIS